MVGVVVRSGGRGGKCAKNSLWFWGCSGDSKHAGHTASLSICWVEERQCCGGKAQEESRAADSYYSGWRKGTPVTKL